MSKRIIGFDLGTTNSCMSYSMKQDAEVIPNKDGSRTTPSIVTYGKEIVVGESAKRMAIKFPKNTIFMAKRLIGRKFNDVEIQKLVNSMPYNIVSDKNNDAAIKLDNDKIITPVEVASEVLRTLKSDAEHFLNEKIEKAIITVPAYFNDSQRRATKQAGEIAGLDVVRVINEPTAAAISYGLDKSDSSKKIVVYDMGGGTFDVSILQLESGVFSVIGTEGDTALGGEDIDRSLLDHLFKEFKRKHSVDLSKDGAAVHRVKEAAEDAKKKLSQREIVDINLPFITVDKDGTPIHLESTITRAQINEMAYDLVKKSIQICDRLLKNLKLSKGEIDDILLVGGMTRMPILQSKVEEYFKKRPITSVNPDEAVALGAAIQGGIMSGDISDIILLDVTPLSLGIETMHGVFTKIVEKNTTIPCEKSQIFTTATDNQSVVTIAVYQGERPLAKDNHLLGQFNLEGIDAAPRGIPQIEVSFDINENGILDVSAKDKKTNKEHKITIQPSGGLNKEELERLKEEAKKNESEDKLKLEKAQALNVLGSMIYQTDQLIKDKNVQNEELNDLKKQAEGYNMDSNIEDINACSKQLNDLIADLNKSSSSGTEQEETQSESKGSDEDQQNQQNTESEDVTEK